MIRQVYWKFFIKVKAIPTIITIDYNYITLQETKNDSNVLHGTSYGPKSFRDYFLLILGNFPAISRQSHNECWLSVGQHELSHGSKHKPKDIKSQDLAGQLTSLNLEITRPGNLSCRRARLASVVLLVGPSCWNHMSSKL